MRLRKIHIFNHYYNKPIYMLYLALQLYTLFFIFPSSYLFIIKLTVESPTTQTIDKKTTIIESKIVNTDCKILSLLKFIILIINIDAAISMIGSIVCCLVMNSI